MGTGGLFLRKVRAKVFEVPTGFVWIERDRLAASGYPASRGQLEWLSAHGIDAILTLTENPLPSGWLDELSLRVKHIPMKDHVVPDEASLRMSASYIREQLNDGKTVLVHCLAGEGRTGCVLAAYLISARKIGAEEAITTLRKLKPAFIETRQEKVMFEFASRGFLTDEPL